MTDTSPAAVVRAVEALMCRPDIREADGANARAADMLRALSAELEATRAQLATARDVDRLEAGRKVMEAAAKICRPGNQRKCSCIQQFESGVYYQECDCQNGGDLAEAQSWCEAANLAQAIERLDLPTILGIKGDGNE